MPFWWRRRRRPWYGRWYKRRYTRKFKRRRRKRRFPRRKYRRASRRRRRGRGKVRRKKKTLPVRQYQPDCIRKCKIKGVAVHIAGAAGKQFSCYTDNSQSWTPELQPGGGGFGVEKFTLQDLYDRNQYGTNIWTQSNKMLDLARYTGGYIKFWRHPHIDFIAKYDRTLPMKLENSTYPGTYPLAMLLGKHKKIIPSLATRPHGKRYVKIKFGPPKLLTNKWVFQETLANTGLLRLQTSIIDLRYPHLGCCNTNRLISIYGINLEFYRYFAWGNPNNPYVTTGNRWYVPYNNAKATLTLDPDTPKKTTINIVDNQYLMSIAYNNGWFQPRLLQAKKIQEEEQIPLTACRYNPMRDHGIGNKIWLASVFNSSYQPPRTDKDLILEGLPLYQLCLGFLDYVQKLKKDPKFLDSYCFFMQSQALEPQHSQYHMFCPIDQSFINGKGPFDSYLGVWDRAHWFPTIKHQQKTINAIVSCGPFMPKLDNQKNSTWELWSSYCFNFKFGGATLPDPETADPELQGTYPVPNNQQQTVQITNPQKTTAFTTLHSWDYRRGIITSTAYQRMCQNQETDTDFQTDGEPPQKKKKTYQGNALPIEEEENQKIKSCLRSLCEESSCQDFQETSDLRQLINQQHIKQQQIKHNLLQLIVDLKNKQKALQLQTGILD